MTVSFLKFSSPHLVSLLSGCFFFFPPLYGLVSVFHIRSFSHKPDNPCMIKSEGQKADWE